MSDALTPQQEADLTWAIEERLVEITAQPFIVKYRGLVAEDDILGLGRVGLVDAVRRHREDLGPFDYYARLRIRGAIRDGVRVEAEEKATQRRLEEAAEAGAEAFCESAGDPTYDVMKHDDEDAARFLEAFVAGVVDAAVGRVLSEVERTPEERVGDVQAYRVALASHRRAKEKLLPVERQVIDLHFGHPPLALLEIARRLGVNYKTVERRRNNALDRMRRLMIEDRVTGVGWEMLPEALVAGAGNDGTAADSR